MANSEQTKPFKPELQRRIMRRIERRERRLLIAKTASFAVIFVGSVSLLVAAYFNLMNALTQSGFFNFASLFFSDFSSAMANFQDFAYSIVESFPVFSAAFVVAGIIAVIWSASHLINDVADIKSHGLSLT